MQCIIIPHLRTVGTHNNKQVGKHRIIPYCESFPYCESSCVIKLGFGKHQHFVVIASIYIITESLIASSDCTAINKSANNYSLSFQTFLSFSKQEVFTTISFFPILEKATNQKFKNHCAVSKSGAKFILTN